MITNIRVLVSIGADTPEEAYDILCGTLRITADDSGALEYTTEVYSTEDAPDDWRNASELWPE